MPLPVIKTDLLLSHPPAYYDFREPGDIYFPYFSTSGSVPVTPLYEYYPLGFKSLQRILGEAGYDVKILNISTLLLKYPGLDLGEALKSVDAKIFGIDLHWMIHTQGALAIAELIKQVHPSAPVIFGGISSTVYAEELIQHDFVDMVMRGYNTHLPMTNLLKAINDRGSMEEVENLLWKKETGEIVDNGVSYIPQEYSYGIDWSSSMKSESSSGFAIREILTATSAGCSFNCSWCGGSRDAFRRIFGKENSVARKSEEEINFEMRSLSETGLSGQYHLYTLASYNEPPHRMLSFIKSIGEAGMGSVNYEQFHLTDPAILKKMVEANSRTTITLSPESHDMKVAKPAGRGVYTPTEMEEWIVKALDIGIHQVDIWYFVGMPEQDEASVYETVKYCERLLKLFKGKRVVPLICPMIPFLDPGSNIFESPEKFGYKIFHRTLEEHRQAMNSPSIINTINYETKWLSREDLVRVGYGAARELTSLKAKHGALPNSIAAEICAKLEDALKYINLVHKADQIKDARERRLELDKLAPEIKKRNNEIFFSGVSNQSFPINRDIGGRWFDDLLWPSEALKEAEACLGTKTK